MNPEVTNGLSEYMALANLTAVGAGIIIFVVLSLWIVMKGVPTLIDREDTSRREFLKALDRCLAALDRQAAARSEAAKSGHDAAFRLADNLQDLTAEVRRVNDTRAYRQTAKSGGG
jgi:hypothetical protein